MYLRLFMLPGCTRAKPCSLNVILNVKILAPAALYAMTPNMSMPQISYTRVGHREKGCRYQQDSTIAVMCSRRAHGLPTLLRCVPPPLPKLYVQRLPPCYRDLCPPKLIHLADSCSDDTFAFLIDK